MTYDENIPGWIVLADLRFIEMLSKMIPEGGEMVEVGAWCGRSTYAWAKSVRSGVKVHVIDSWLWMPEYPATDPGGPLSSDNDPLELFKKYTSSCDNIIIHQGHSPMTHPPIPEHGFDLVFLDGDHQSPGIDNDIDFWSNHLKKETGVICGDDYGSGWQDGEDRWPNITNAVNRLRDKTNFTLFTSPHKLWALLPDEQASNFLLSNKASTWR